MMSHESIKVSEIQISKGLAVKKSFNQIKVTTTTLNVKFIQFN